MQVIASPEKTLGEDVLSRGIRFNYAPKTVLYTQDEPAEKVFYLEEGLVRFCLVSQDGAQKTLCYIEKGNIFGAIGILLGRCYGSTAVAATKVRVVCFGKDQFWTCFREHHEFAELCAISMAEICWYMGKQINSLSFLDRFGKVASSLMYLGKRWGEPMDCGAGDKGPVRLRITHQELAEFTGTSRVTVTSVLDEFEARKLIRKRPQEIIITDMSKLEEWVR